MPPRPRGGLVILGLVLFAAVTGGLGWRLKAATVPEAQTDAGRVVRKAREFTGNTGPWGQLKYSRIGIEPPDDFIPVDIDWGPTRWLFPVPGAEAVASAVRGAGVDETTTRALLTESTVEVGAEGTLVSPPFSLVSALTPDTRTRLYTLLSASPVNRQHYPVPFFPEFLEERIEASGLRQETIDLFRRMLYRRGSWLLFADESAVLSQLPERRERLRFLSMLARNATFLVTLQIPQGADVSGIAKYWGYSGRHKDLEPLLQSLARIPGGGEIDLSHLLPPFARRRIYTYPKPQTDRTKLAPDCFWTAMNFFAETPDENMDSLKIAVELGANYERVPEPIFGDIAILSDQNKQPVHAAIYLADQLVFTKNGAKQFQPWMYMKLDAMVDLYRVLGPPGQQLSLAYFRRKAQ